MIRYGVAVSGRGTNLQAILDAAAQSMLPPPEVVFCNRPGAAAIDRAEAAGIPVEVRFHKEYPKREAFDRAAIEALAPYELQGMVLAGYMRIVTPTFLKAFSAGVVNIHPSLLPAFPGVDAVRQAWEYGVKVTGCTVHLVDEKVDHGPILAQESIPVLDDDDPESLASRLLDVEHRLLVGTVKQWIHGEFAVDGRRVTRTQ